MSVILARELNNLLNTPFYADYGARQAHDSVSYGSYHQQTNENEHIIEVPLVGLTREDVTVDVQDGVLTVSAKTNANSRFVRNFKQSWNLTKDSDTEAVTAKLENGLLSVRIPRVKPVKKVINIDVV